MLRPESPLADHRSLLPRRLLPAKAQIAPSLSDNRRKNRRSLELNPPSNDHTSYDYPKLLISKTTDSLNTECPRKTVHKQDSNDSLKRALLAKEDKKALKESEKRELTSNDSSESLKKALLSRQDSNDSVKRRNSDPKRIQKQDNVNNIEVKKGIDKKSFLEIENDDTYKRVYERRTGCVKPSLPPVAEKSLGSPSSPTGSSKTLGVAAVAEGVVRWGSGLLSPREEPRLKTARSWYGYGTLPTDSDKMGAANGPGGRRAFELILSGGLKSLARPTKPVRRAASRDSVLSQPQPLLEGLRKCSTVLALTDREKVTEPIRPHNRLRAPSVCSRCSSLLSLAGAGGSRYSLDGAGGVFVPAAPVNCKLCLEDATPDKVTVIGGCGCAYCTKVLSALSFFASGSYQRFIGASAHHKMHQVSVSNCVRAVTLALNNDHFRRKYIHFPQTREERNIIKTGFYQKFGMPGVVGCIDGTHVAIVRPAEFEERFFNRKRYHSLNVQIVCDSDLNIVSVDAAHGGANHDSYVWNRHPLKTHLERLRAENESVWLLGDSGYPLRPTLMTPIVDTEPDSPQRYYTELHCRVRNTVERCIGVLKSRWRCLLVDRKLHYHPITAGYITNACVVLHNIANAERLPAMPLTQQEERNEASFQCMKAYVEFEVRNGAYEVSCPDAKCRVGCALALDEISALVEPSLMEKHLKYRLNHEVSMDANRMFCPNPKCGDTVVPVRAASPAHCPTCRQDYCSQCNQEWHGDLTCEAAAASSSMGGAGTPLLADSELIKQCPMCRVPIEKDEGCAQMMCKRCKHVFCWYCLASLDDDFLLRHYDKGPCKNKLGHSRASVLWHRAQVVGIFAGFGLLLLVASPLLLLAAPCIVCCKCRLCNPNTKNLEEVDEIDSISPGREENDDDIAGARFLAD